MQQILYERLVRYILNNQDQFYRLAYSYTRHQEDALDAVQSAVCKALGAYESIKNADAMKTWFYKILVNECCSILRKRGKVVLTADGVDPEPVYYERGYEQRADVEQELAKLDMETQSIIKLRFFEEMSLNEISDITGLNPNTVKTKLYRGLKRLKANIQEEELWTD